MTVSHSCVSSRTVIITAATCRRQDIEIEMDRFEGARDAAAKKYTFMERPEGGEQEKVDIAVDALATLIGADNAKASSQAVTRPITGLCKFSSCGKAPVPPLQGYPYAGHDQLPF